MPDDETASAQPRIPWEPGGAVFLTNGNLNGRVIRLVADHVHQTSDLRATVVSFDPLTTWPEQRASPHLVEALRINRLEAVRRIASARVFVYAASWYNNVPELVRLARQAGTPSVCVMADIGFGVEKIDPADPSTLPDRLCVADPVTKTLFLRRGVPPSILREVGSPYLDTVLHDAPPGPLESSEQRVGLLVNPELDPGPFARSTNRAELDVARQVHQAVATVPGSLLTLRLHPRLTSPHPIDLPGATIDPIEPRSSMTDFVSGQHRILGSYSTGLLVARMLGRPALSFQPSPQRPVQRAEVFEAWGIPVVRDAADVRAWLLEPLEERMEPFAIEAHLYQPGRSIEAIAEVIREIGCASAIRAPRRLEDLNPPPSGREREEADF